MREVRPNNIRIAREFRNLKLTELSKKIGSISISKLSKIESGLVKANESDFELIRKTLGFPEEFFFKEFYSDIRNDFKYRSRKIPASIKSEIEANIHIVLNIIDSLVNENFDINTHDFTDFINDPLNKILTIEEIAMKMRTLLSVDRTNEENLIRKIEKLGIVVLEVQYSKYEDSKILKTDGTSAVTKNGIPVILINKHFPNSRKKFTLAHELGHVILHLFKYSNTLSEKEMEDEANLFASEFLLPRKFVSKELRVLNIEKLKTLKSRYGVSMGALLYKAKNLDLISEDKYKNIIIEMSRKGILRNEPLEMAVKIDKPNTMNYILENYDSDFGYNDDEMAKTTNLFLKDYRKLKWLYFNNHDNVMKLI